MVIRYDFNFMYVGDYGENRCILTCFNVEK